MNPELIGALAVLLGAVLTFAGGLIGHFVTSKRSRKELEANTKKEIDAVQQQLIDQLQEERDRLDDKLEKQEKRHAEDVDKLNRRITGFYADKSASRKYIGMLESHIFQGKPPPPPAPPSGYVP